MERETKTITTPVAKHEVVLKSYVTGREKRAYTAIFLKGGVSFSTTGEIKGMQGDMYEEAENLLLAFPV